MYLISIVVVICALVSLSYAGWLREVSTSRGLNLGSGVSLHLDDVDNKNATQLERHALRLDVAGYGVSVSKKPTQDAIQLGFYVNEKEKSEGRGEKVGEMAVPMVMGFKLAALVTATLGTMAVLVIKALGIAKLALIIPIAILISKAMHHEENSYVEIEHLGSDHHPVIDYHSSGIGNNNDNGASGAGSGMYHPSASTNYYAYSNYIPSASAVAEVPQGYATVEAAALVNNATGGIISPIQQVAAVAAKRRDYTRRKHKLPIFTVRRYSVET